MTDYRGSTGYGEKFTLDIQGDPLAGPANDINDAADEAIKRFAFIDGTRQAAGGASYGGHLTNWLAGTTTRYRCLVSHAGLATLEMQWGISDGIYHRELMMGGPYWENPSKWIAQSPLAKAGSFKTPTLLSVGLNDFRVPEGNTLTMYSALQRMNVPTRLLIWPDENHWILKGENSRVFYREVRAWLEEVPAAGVAADRRGRPPVIDDRQPPPLEDTGLRRMLDVDVRGARRLAAHGLCRRGSGDPLFRQAVAPKVGARHESLYGHSRRPR